MSPSSTSKFCSNVTYICFTFLLIFQILLQNKASGLEHITIYNNLKYFKSILRTPKSYLLANNSCKVDSCKKNVKFSIPLGEKVYPLTSSTSIPLLSGDNDLNRNKSGRRIIGGGAVSITDFPFIVSVQIYNNHLCGGTYIKPMWVLSAAHCMVNVELVDTPVLNPSLYTVVMGSAIITGEGSDSANIQVREVLTLYPHENYRVTYKLNDIGLIKIEKPFHLTASVAFVKLPKSEYEAEYRPEMCTVVGWGSTVALTREKHASVPSPILMGAKVPLITLTSCQKIYGIDLIVPLQIMCAGATGGGKDACQGDSGGPLICQGIQIGIVSWGEGCGQAMQPGVYTRLDNFLSWTNGIIEKYTAGGFLIFYDGDMTNHSNCLYHIKVSTVVLFLLVHYVTKTACMKS